MPKRERSKMDTGDQDFVTELLSTLESRGFVKQLRLECIADVKTKATYLQLKERMKDYVTSKMSEEWTSDNTFREQVVECGVLALTVERVVEEVVTRKLREDLRLLVIDLIKQHGNKNLKSKVHVNGTKNLKASATDTLTIVSKICNDTKKDYKRVKEQGIIGHSLASVSFPKLSDNDNASDDHSELSAYESDASDNETSFDNRIIKAEPDDDDDDDDGVNIPNPNVRVRRERKFNSKYSQYHTSLPSVLLTPPTVNNSNTVHVTNGSPSSLNLKQARKLPQQLEQFPAKRKLIDTDVETEKAIRSPFKQHAPLPSPSKAAVQYTKPSSVQEDSNGIVRKSGRQRKINSIIFWDSLQSDPNSSQPPLAKTVTEPERVPRATNNNSVSEDMESLRSDVQKKNVKSITIPVNSSPVTAVHSSKRYDSSDLYKPRLLLTSSSRMKKSQNY